jgi:ribosome modulation factor
MPRRKKTVDADETPTVDGNVTKATVLQHHDAIVEKLRVKKEADSALAHAWKQCERDGIDKKELKRIIAERDMSADELAVRDRKYALYRAWLAKPVGYQASMLDKETAPNGHDTEAEAHAVEQHQQNEAYDDGYRAGRAGSALSFCPFEIGSQQYQDYSLGWSSGQKAAVESLGGATV